MKSGEPRSTVLPIGVRACWALIAGGITVAGALLLPRRPAGVPLSEQRIRVDADIDDVFKQLASFDRGPTVIERNGNQIIAEFPVRVGWLRVTTLERVSLDHDRHRITFEQLRSPFFSVRTATEVFQLSSLTGGATLVSLDGSLSPRLGLVGWLVTRYVVRSRWDAIDGNFLRRLGHPSTEG
jgi:hypothetical protein